MKKKKPDSTKPIAVIEEIADNIYSVKFVLQSLGYEVRSFSAPAAFNLELAEFKPGLIVVDMMIPDSGAYEVIKHVKSGPLKRVPILAITAEAMDGDEKAVYAAGGKDVLAKPYTVTALQKKLKKLLK